MVAKPRPTSTAAPAKPAASTKPAAKPTAGSAKPAPKPDAAPKPAVAPTSPGPLIDVDWLVAHLDEPNVRVIHVSPDRKVYNKRHIAGAVYSDLHRELALKGTAPETGAAEREWLVPTREQTETVLRRWRVGAGDRIVFYDDIGMNRQAIRGYWLLRLYGFRQDRLHILDGGIEAWRRAEQPTTTEIPEADLAGGLRQPVKLGALDHDLIATYDEVLAWSRESTATATSPGATAPTRILDVRTAAEWIGTDLRATRGGHIPGARQRCFVDLLTDQGTFRPVDEMVSLIRASGVDPAELRATYCQGGVRAALVWFVLHELAGFDGVKSYAGSWEEWGNRSDSPIESP